MTSRGFIRRILLKAENIYKLAWVINGKKTTMQAYDAKMLNVFLTGQEGWTRDFGEEASMKSQLPRLRELLGEPKK